LFIEKLISNPQTLKRWRRFKKIRRATFASWVFLFLLLISLTAEVWSNDKPIYMKFQGQNYWPIFKTYHPSIFGIENEFITEYKKINLGSEDWAIWPIIRWSPLETNKNTSLESYPAPPSAENLLGTDDRGRDVLSRLIYGFRYSIIFALLVWFFSYAVGISLGAVMGYFAGRVDMVGQRVLEVLESVPGLLLLITLISVFSANMTLLILFSVFFGWMMISIYTRAEFLKLRHREFVESARALGASHMRLIFKHILPNSLGPVITFSTFTIAGSISSLAILDYLGFGLPPPTPSWGELLNQAQKNFTLAWWLALYPSLALFVTLVSLNLIGEGIRDAFDPKHN
jgi:microcin C transport system permease protein